MGSFVLGPIISGPILPRSLTMKVFELISQKEGHLEKTVLLADDVRFRQVLDVINNHTVTLTIGGGDFIAVAEVTGDRAKEIKEKNQRARGIY